MSGGGSNFKALHAATLDGRINGRITVREKLSGSVPVTLAYVVCLPRAQVVVSDKGDCGGVAYARSHGMQILRFPAPKEDPSEGLSSSELVHALQSAGIQLVLLAGYLKLVPAELCRAFPRAILNIHPALLPAFGGKGMYGHRVHVAVVASGAKFSGPTVHFVDEEYDRGKIVAQRCVPVLPDDTPEDLAHRVLEQVRFVRCPRSRAHCVRALMTTVSPAGMAGIPRSCCGIVCRPHHLEGGRRAHHTTKQTGRAK